MIDNVPAIEARRLSKSFGHQLVLDQLNLSVAAGESVCILGANGAGKTTLIRCLASVIRPSSGDVLWFGQPARSPELRHCMGLVGHESYLYPDLTIHENLLFAARMCDVANPRDRVAQLLETIGLQSHARRRTAEVSRGMRQRLALGRALVHQPQVVLLDEPFAGLDAQGTDWLLTLLQGLRSRGGAICFSTHDESTARQLTDRSVRLRAGRLHGLESARDRICA